MINEKQDILKESEDVKLDDLKEAQIDLNEKKDDLKESQEDCNEKGDGINEIIHTSTVEVTEVCPNFKEDEDLVEHSENVVPVNQTEEENDNKIVVSSDNDALNLESKGESETEESTVGVAVHVDDCHNIKEDEHTTNTDFIASTQTNPDITFTNAQETSANLESLESHEPKDDECEISSLSLDASSPLQDSRKDEIEIQDAVKQEVAEVTEIEYTTEQVESEIKNEPEVAPSNLVIQTEMMFKIKDVNSEETILNNGDKTVCALEESDGQIVDQEITHQMQIPNDDDVSLDSKTSKFDESINEVRDHLDEDIHHISSMLSASETVCFVESNHQDRSGETCSDEAAIEEDITKVMDATVEELVPDSSVNEGLNHSELTENTDNKEPQYKINLNERNMSDPEILLETIRMMEEAKAKGPSVEIMTTDLDAEDLSGETTLHPVNNTEESKVNNIEINNFQNSNTNDEEGSIGEPSDQSLAMSSSTSTEQSDNVAKMKPTYTDNSNGTVFV
ncbi:cylicin-1 [Octopus bimaculoides]|nr:cylicin-1 [Octopus bimaculoides]|eukprot:XP_014789262.1 PREDICTED: cylicin-1-like [Octopus bimaculoides]